MGQNKFMIFKETKLNYKAPVWKVMKNINWRKNWRIRIHKARLLDSEHVYISETSRSLLIRLPCRYRPAAEVSVRLPKEAFYGDSYATRLVWSDMQSTANTRQVTLLDLLFQRRSTASITFRCRNA